MTKAFFITGTGTGVGKTWVSAAVAMQALDQGLTVAYYKPIQTGTPPGAPPEDQAFVDTATQGQAKTYCRYCFAPPAAPAAADPERTIAIDRILQDIADYLQEADVVLVEGAGGLMVPIASDYLMVDLIQALGMPVLLVAHSQLGTINHTLLSIEALQRRNIPIHGVVMNFYPANPADTADPSTETLLATLRPHVPSDMPLWTYPILEKPLPLLENFNPLALWEREQL